MPRGMGMGDIQEQFLNAGVVEMEVEFWQVAPKGKRSKANEFRLMESYFSST